MQINHNPIYIQNYYLGPISQNDDRIYRTFSDNLAPSFVPTPLIYRDAQAGYLKGRVEDYMLRPQVTHELLSSLTEYIQDQVEGRIASFWRQALLVYKTGLNITFCGADAQVGRPGNSNGQNPGAYNCAHQATLPALRVVMAGKTIAFGQKSTFHWLDNATGWLPVDVNNVDTALDCQFKFRDITANILNLISFSHYNPEIGLYMFLESAKKILLGYQPSQITTLYLEVIDNYLEYLDEDDTFIRHLSGEPRFPLDHESLYMYLQAQMHRQLIYEMERLKPQITDREVIKARMQNFNFNYLFYYLNWVIRERPLIPTPAICKYSQKGSEDEPIKIASLTYLLDLQRENDLWSDVESLWINNSVPLRVNKLASAIKDRFSKNPNNMGQIVVRILHVVCHNPFLP